MVPSNRMRWTGHVTAVAELRIAYKILFGKTEGRRASGRLGVDECESMDWVCLLVHEDKWRALVHTVMNCEVA